MHLYMLAPNVSSIVLFKTSHGDIASVRFKRNNYKFHCMGATSTGSLYTWADVRYDIQSDRGSIQTGEQSSILRRFVVFTAKLRIVCVDPCKYVCENYRIGLWLFRKKE